MEFSNPFPTNVPRKMNSAELVRAIMQDIAAELDAVALYQAHIDATDDERAKKLLAHIRDDEKEHVGEFMALLEILDPKQADYMKKGKKEIAELTGEK
jgi:rubrerythrin